MFFKGTKKKVNKKRTEKCQRKDARKRTRLPL